MKIVDAFTFYNELDMLEYRLTVLDPVVDWFVLVEATLTHAGHSKPLYFQENRDRFAKWAHKLIHIVVDDMPETSDAWVRERFQRSAVNRGFDSVGMRSMDLILVSDLDEIPNPQRLAEVRESAFDGFARLELDLYYYSYRFRAPTPWHHAKLCSYDTYVNLFRRDPNQLRLTFSGPVLMRGGWHFSYFGSPDFIRNKLQNFAHQEFNTPSHTSLSFIQTCVTNGASLFDTGRLESVPLDSNPFPPPHLDVLLHFFPV